MFKSILVDKKLCPCVYKNIGLILASLLLVWGLSGCSSLSSVRSAKVGEHELTSEEIASLKEDGLLDEEFETEINPKDYLAKLESEKEEIVENKKSKNKSNKALLPPLNRQLERMHAEQEKMKKDVNNLKDDVSDIKKTLNQIKNSIENLPTEQKIAQKGPAHNSNETNSNDEFIISSDESLADNARKKKVDNNNKKNKYKTVSVKSNELQKSIDFSLAEELLEKKDYHSAIAQMKKIESKLKNENDKTEFNYILGNSNYGLRQYGKAIEYFIKVLSSPEFAGKDRVRVMLADSHIRTGSPDKAVTVYRKLIENHPGSSFLPKARKMLQQL
jgi:TolA-binding protein